MKRFLVTLPENIWEELEKRAKDSYITKSRYIIAALEDRWSTMESVPVLREKEKQVEKDFSEMFKNSKKEDAEKK